MAARPGRSKFNSSGKRLRARGPAALLLGSFKEQNRFAVAKPYKWVDFCGRRMKAGVFDLRAGARYWIQMSASPEPTLDLFVAGPLN